MVCLNNNLPVPVLAYQPAGCESREELKRRDAEVEARESTDTTADTLKAGSDSRGGQRLRAGESRIENRESVRENNLSVPPLRRAQKIKQDAAYYRSYRARNKERIQKQEEKRRSRDRNKKWVVQTVTGLPDIGIKVLSEFQVDVAMRAFWGKRGMAVPSATMGGILPSVSDFNEEVSILQMRTCI